MEAAVARATDGGPEIVKEKVEASPEKSAEESV
jgi:hypothetical protein